MKKTIALLLCLMLFLPVLAAFSEAAAPEREEAARAETTLTARPSVNGRLHVKGTTLADEAGQTVVLRGVSTHGLTWFPEFVSETLFRRVSTEWNGNLIRLAMYSSQYCGGYAEESLTLLRKGIDAAVAADMYVLVDWHILEDSDPNTHVKEAAGFFEQIASEYADVPNLLFEICNEPNGETDWADILAYCDEVIPVIRKQIPDSVILVGTPEFDRNLGSAVLRPVPYDNVMAVLHFYAATHGEGLLGELKAAVESGLPVFISECGVSEASGDGDINFDMAARWFDYLNRNSISYAVWSLSDKNESSAIFRPGFDPEAPIRDADLTVSGRWVKALISGEDPKSIPYPAPTLEKGRLSELWSFLSAGLGDRGTGALRSWPVFAGVGALAALLFAAAAGIFSGGANRKNRSYDALLRSGGGCGKEALTKERALAVSALLLSILFTLVYLCWRVCYSVPTGCGVLPVAANVLLLAVELLGFAESLVLFRSLLGLKRYPLPEIAEDAYPEVDIFIATYNEPTELLRRTVNGCVHLKYPDPKKVHIWICDDNRRSEMRALAEEMGVGYFDRPDNKGAKAGNLNHALALTGAPYVVTLDADMIPRSDFLLKTIPYFVDAEERNSRLPENGRMPLGLLQTPQCFYDPDVFQHALYSEKRAPNEQDFFYRTIEPAKTSTNSVIYGGSNTVIARKALEDVGGFYTGSITEDFATGLLIESHGYVSLALPVPLASGQTPHTYKEHIQQRTRWGRGVLATARQLKIWRRKNLSLDQKISYWSSVIYWYSPIKNLIYILSPLLFAVFALPVFKCNWLELLVFWLPMYLMQDVSLKLCSKKTISNKWSGIYETSVMPHLLIPIIKESLGISLSAFKVTDKTRKAQKQSADLRSMLPFLILALLSVVGIVRVLLILDRAHAISLLILLFWLVRNLYFLILSIFLVDGRDDDTEPVKVRDFIPVTLDVLYGGEGSSAGITTELTEHNMTVYLDEGAAPGIGDHVRVTVLGQNGHQARVDGVVTGIREARRSESRAHTVEILDFGGDRYEYWEILYDRIPSLPQSLRRDFGIVTHLWQNIAHRVARTRR